MNTVLKATIFLVVLACVVTTASAESFKEMKDKIEKKYGVRPLAWAGWADEKVRDAPTRSVFHAVAKQVGVPATYLYTIAIGEGMNEWLDDEAQSKDKKTYDLSKKVNGFDYAGLDHFSSDFDRIKKHLPASFKKGTSYVSETRVNEQNKKVRSASFADFKAAMMALGAVVRHRQDLAIADAKAIGVTLNEDQKAYWTYAYFLDGEGDGKTDLKKTKGNYTKSTRNVIKSKTLTRVASWRYVLARKVFP